MTGRFTRIIRWLLMLLAAGFAALCVGFTPARNVRLLDAAGTPIEGVYVGYHYRSSVFNFVDTVGRYEPGRLLRSDAQGRVRLPARLALKSPLHSQPKLQVHFVYAPRQHNAMRGGLGSDARPGVFEINAERDTLRLYDLGPDPARWEDSLGVLYSWVRYEAWSTLEQDAGNRVPRVRVSRAELSPLVAELQDEYRQLIERHADTVRRLPNDAELAAWPAAGQEERLSRLREELIEEPLWGALLQSRWQQRMQGLADEWEASGAADQESKR